MKTEHLTTRELIEELKKRPDPALDAEEALVLLDRFETALEEIDTLDAALASYTDAVPEKLECTAIEEVPSRTLPVPQAAGVVLLLDPVKKGAALLVLAIAAATSSATGNKPSLMDELIRADPIALWTLE